MNRTRDAETDALLRAEGGLRPRLGARAVLGGRRSDRRRRTTRPAESAPFHGNGNSAEAREAPEDRFTATGFTFGPCAGRQIVLCRRDANT